MRIFQTNRCVIATVLICIGAVASAAQPPDSVTSDSNFNTAMGAGVLFSLTTGENNTGAGYGALYYNTTGDQNTAFGESALAFNATGTDNAAFGFNALGFNTVGLDNTALGIQALQANTVGNLNTGAGFRSLFKNTTGGENAALGAYSLTSNTAGNGNAAFGDAALYYNTTGDYNTAVGYQSLAYNTTGGYTTSVGAYSLGANTTGGYDTAFGAYSLPDNTTGTGNTAFGYAALRSNTIGNNNIGFGYQAMYLNPTGSSNIAMGYQAGYYATGSYNIEIGSEGARGDNAVIRIGTQGTQTATYIAGISGATITGAAVYVTSSGQLGVQASSERYKTAIASMGTRTRKLQALRPVTFHLKSDPNAVVQYGLIAEEVDKVYPELVIRDQTGKIQGVHYEELAPMMLNELQQQAAEINALKKLLGELRAGMIKLQSREELAALR